MPSRISMALGTYGAWGGELNPGKQQGSSAEAEGVMERASLRKDQEPQSPVSCPPAFWPPLWMGSGWGEVDGRCGHPPTCSLLPSFAWL